MRYIALTGLLILALTAQATAEEQEFPSLGDHRFVPVTALTEPFLVTYVQSTVGLGWTVNSTTPLINPSDSTMVGSVESDQLLTGLGFQYQQGVKDWLVVKLALDVVGRLGADTNSLLADGVTGAFGYDIGWMMRIYNTRSLLVSGSLGLGTGNATFLNLLALSEDLAAGEDAELVSSRTSLVGYGGLHAAWGINRRFGLLGSLYASYGESFDGSGDNSWHSDGRLALSYDMEQDLSIPLGLALTGGRSENDVNADSEAGTWFWQARLALQGRSDFSIGANFGVDYFEVASQSDRLQFTNFSIDMRYYY